MADRCDAVSPLPLRAVLRADEVVATGRAENVLQVPSPIYTAIFVDAHHALIGAGGGGRRFGMPNIALLLRVQSLSSASKADPTAKAPATSSAPAAAASPVWSFAAAVDLGSDDIPWCTSSFLPFEASAHDGKARSGASTEPAALDWTDAQRRVLDGLVGFVALSTMASFSLLGVFRGPEPSTSQATEPSASSAASAPANASGDVELRRYLRQLARIEVPNDAKNPDKKPIALVHNLVLVSHDDNGVLAFALTDLVPDSFEDEDFDAYRARYADQTTNGDSGAVLQRRVPRVRTEAAPVASWQLPARVNDLSVSRVCIVQADASNGASSLSQRPCKARLQEHLVVAALLLNKTLVLSTVRLRRRYIRSRSHKASVVQGEETTAEKVQTEAKSDTAAAATVSTALTLTEDMLPLPFKLLTSSLRLVRLFGWGDIDAAQQADMRRRLTWQSLQAGGAPTHGPLCGIMVVVYNSVTNESYVIHGSVEVTPLTSSVPSSCTWDSIGSLGLKVQWAREDPAPVLSDAITSLAVYTDGPPGDYASRVSANPLGAAVPARWIAGTVEGWVASLRLSHDSAQPPHWQADQIRPSPNKSVARRYPALHKEPVSCVAVSSENDVVSADIAQNVALTTLPYAVPRVPSSVAASPSSKILSRDVVVQPRSTSSSPLFPPAGAVSGGPLGSLTDNVANALPSLRVAWFLLIPLVLLLAGMII
ncbi:conserved hypothetical protein [Leishmania major strain Friedlin]|uniref:Uncharacterized protein n=1 Tax=Leishmania major TaxID=5664 RepID=E9AE12_LEIMA|nr:conserved hypothetical protein [Leishmania major strain Friedlin]CAG9577891.1 hypothetical_protein_-_conserved [Leishmania major strain Friedlin]CBZ12491.1 conserved hypothetical protein [Leishmania major strain Friedlin]|eukprot:XP_003722233.1 conserved hypothetical protein [Leishmania major strain Friedlin]